jgi:hypothetical protein
MQGILFTEANRKMIRAGVKVQTRRLMRLRTVKGGKEWVVEYPRGQARRTTPSGIVDYAPVGLHCVDCRGELRSFATEVVTLSPYGPVGSARYIKERCTAHFDDEGAVIIYEDGDTKKIPGYSFNQEWNLAGNPCKTIQAMFMPESVARTRLKITGLSYGYVRDIDAVDAIKEGVEARATVRDNYSDEEWLTARFRHKDENCWRDYSRNDAWGLTAEQSYRTMWESIHCKNDIESLWDLAVVWIIDFSVEDDNGKV